jgi:cell division protein FtsW (lipid II flippase)
VSARNRELLALIPASLLLTAGFAAIFIQESDVLSDISLTYGAWFLGLCFAGHLFLRFTLPYADPYMFPLVAVLACFGLVVIYRIDEDLARQQANWFVFGLLLFALTILLLRDLRVLERYRYTIAFAGLALLFLPRVPGIGQQVNGAYLGVGIGPISFQPAEFGKIAIIIFLAAYLRDTRQVLVQGSRRFLFVTIPPTKHFGPLLVVWGAAMVMLVFIRDLGSSLMYFGGFLALLYVATNRLSFVAIGMAMFAVGAWFFASTVPHVQERVDIWLDPFKPEWVERQGYQIAQSLFAQAEGGLFGTGLGASLLNAPNGNSLIPAPHTDLIYAVVTSELGLVGACGLILVYMLFVERGFRTAMLAADSFSKLLAAGLSAVFALQVFVIVGGVTKVIPLTGVTLPFVSYGGSSILANFVLLALLLLVSDHARRPSGVMGRRGLR